VRYTTFWWYFYARARSNDVRGVPAPHGRHLQTVAQRILDDQRVRADEQTVWRLYFVLLGSSSDERSTPWRRLLGVGFLGAAFRRARVPRLGRTGAG